MIAIVILSVAVFGASGYRYYAALDAQKAAKHITAARIGLLLCESWRGVQGTETYDPTAHFVSDLTITKITDSIEPGHKDEGFTLLGGYMLGGGKGFFVFQRCLLSGFPLCEVWGRSQINR